MAYGHLLKGIVIASKRSMKYFIRKGILSSIVKTKSGNGLRAIWGINILILIVLDSNRKVKAQEIGHLIIPHKLNCIDLNNVDIYLD